MKVPLMITVSKDNLYIYMNGECVKPPSPFKPFVLIPEDIKFNINSSMKKEDTSLWTKFPESIKKDYTRYTFDSIDSQNAFVNSNTDLEKHIYYNSYLEQMYISSEDYVLNFANTKPLRILHWDIEVKTTGGKKFPKALTSPILCIGYSIWEYGDNGSKKKISQKILKNYVDEPDVEDHLIIKEFINDIITEDPDIIAGYNSEFFDFPYLYERAKIRKLTINIGRNGHEPMIKRNGGIHIDGRIHYDSFLKAKKDQSLFSLKNRTLKTLARHYKCDLSAVHDAELEGDIKNTFKIFKEDPERLWTYQEADILRTEHVNNIYIRNDITLAEQVKVSLRDTMDSYPSFIPKIFCARNEYKLNLINAETNFQKYNSETGSIAKFRKYDNKELKFRGALVGMYKRGYFNKIWKIDFTSMYPSAICTFNLGPDTTKLVRVEPFTGKYKFHSEGNYNWYRVPDSNFDVDLIIRVDMSKDGFLKKDIMSLWEERKKIKTEQKKCEKGDDKWNALDSQQLAIKVLLNSIYGMMGLKSTKYGDMMSAVMVTAMCRWTTTNTIIRYKDILVELDTDGLIVDKQVSEEETNEWLSNLIKSTFNLKENFMSMELDEFEDAYFYAMKNYVLRKGDRFDIHGSSMKSSRTCAVVDRARNIAIQHIFNNKPIEEVIMEAYDFNSCKLEDFVFRVKPSKETSEYDDDTAQVPLLAAQYKLLTGEECDTDTQLEYVITKNQRSEPELSELYKSKKSKGHNYTYLGFIANKSEINLAYYENMIDKSLLRFGIKKNMQMNLFAALDMVEDISDGKPLDKVPESI